jgi:uncharacterized membrane protein
VVGAVETGAAATVSLASLFMPVIAGILVVFILVFVFFIYRKLRPRRKTA